MGDNSAEKAPDNMPGEQDDRETRRIRRELLRTATEDDEALLDESDDEAGPTTRARSRDSTSEKSMETETEENRALVNQEMENPAASPAVTETPTEQDASGAVPSGAAPPPPPPL
jgi:hypothetical protein